MSRKRSRFGRDEHAHADMQFGPSGHGGRRKVSQLCEQVREALSLGLACSADQVLQDLSVISVAPSPDASRLLVTVIEDRAPDVSEELDRRERVLQKLETARGYLRSEVASAIHRKKTPDLVFRVVGTPASTIG